MTDFIYLISNYPENKRVKVVVDFLRSKEGHILWQVEDEEGTRYVVSPTSLIEAEIEENQSIWVETHHDLIRDLKEAEIYIGNYPEETQESLDDSMSLLSTNHNAKIIILPAEECPHD